VSGSKTSEIVPVRAYRRGTPSEGAVRERPFREPPFREPPLRSLLESRALLVLLAIMLLGAVLRFYGLGFQSLWSDELASWDFSNRETISQVIAAVGLAYLIFSMDYYTTPTKEQFREAALYVVGHEDKNTLVVRCDPDDRLDYYLKTRETGQRNDAEACKSSDFPQIENRVKEGDYKEVFHFISHEDPDQQMVAEFQRSFQPVRYERFDGAAVVVYKVRPSVPEGLTQPEPPGSLPRQE
jgi:hypothetical protein